MVVIFFLVFESSVYAVSSGPLASDGGCGSTLLGGGCRQLAHRPYDGHFWVSFMRRPIHHFAITLVLRAHDLLGLLVSHFLARLCVRSADMIWLRRGLHIWKRGQLKRGGEL